MVCFWVLVLQGDYQMRGGEPLDEPPLWVWEPLDEPEGEVWLEGEH